MKLNDVYIYNWIYSSFKKNIYVWNNKVGCIFIYIKFKIKLILYKIVDKDEFMMMKKDLIKICL